MNSELLFKVFLTIVVLYFSIGSLRWIWRSQIDVKETGRKILETPQKSMDWVATRESDKIYQNGKIVGTVFGTVKESDQNTLFSGICDTSLLDENTPFDYQRNTFKIVSRIRIGFYDGGDAIGRKNVITDVVCKKIQE